MFLLDTNACIEIMNATPAQVRRHFEREANAGNALFASSITTFELWYGVAKSGRPEFNRGRLSSFFEGPIQTLPFDDADSMHAGVVRVALERQGTPIGPFDLLIAGQALARGLTLVTHNTDEFARVPGLQMADWQA
jgi:tRNA(fMet)-specific endonuclease VapC